MGSDTGGAAKVLSRGGVIEMQAGAVGSMTAVHVVDGMFTTKAAWAAFVVAVVVLTITWDCFIAQH